MNLLDAAAVFAAGVAAGGINTVVGSGSLITFPTLVALGYVPVVANVSNNIGLVPGGVTGAYGYRAELKGQRARLLRLGSASLTGAVIGALLLLGLPASAFKFIVPILIVIALILVVVQPRLQGWIRRRREDGGGHAHGGPLLWVGVLLAGMYGGYFGAAQGVLLMAILGIGVADTLQRHNATKNVLALIVNGVAAVVFVVKADVDWRIAGLIAAGSVVGGQVGATVGRRLPPTVLRAVIVVVGVVAIVTFVL